MAAPASAEQISGEDWSGFQSADVIVFGEIHDNPHHHMNQARAVAALKPGAIVFEMLTPGFARKATAKNRRNAAALADALEWTQSGWPDFSMYFPIFSAAPDAAIIGGGAPRETVRRAMEDGAAAVFGGGAELFGLDKGHPDDVQAKLEDDQQAAHCNALPAEMLPGMVEAQRFRDASLARAALAAVHETRARNISAPVIVITGNGHARNDFGVPSLLAKLDEDLLVISVGQFEIDAANSPNYDHWIVTEAVARPDPCEAFE